MEQHTTQQKLQTILQQEVTRKQFLGVIFGAIAGLMGFSGLVGLFTKNQPQMHSSLPGYGQQGYGP